MFAKGHTVIIYIGRYGFTLYQDVLSGIVKFPFDPNIVYNIDVLDPKKLSEQIKALIQQNKLIPSNLIILLSDTVLFSKEFNIQQPQTQPLSPAAKNNPHQEKIKLTTLDKTYINDEIEKYLEIVPFDEILAKTYTVNTNTKIFAANKILINTITEPFKQKGFIIEAIIPSSAFKNIANLEQGITPNEARIILEKPEVIKQNNMLIDQHISQSEEENNNDKKPTQPTGKNNTRVLILVGIFAALMLVLIVVIILSIQSQVSTKKIVPTPTLVPNTSTPIPLVSQSPTISESPVASESASSVSSSLQIAISVPPGNRAQADTINKDLATSGYRSIQIGTTTNTSGPTTVVFSKDVLSYDREIISQTIKTIKPNALIREDISATQPVAIVVGN